MNEIEKLELHKGLLKATLEEVLEALKAKGGIRANGIVLRDDDLKITVNWMERIQAALDNTK